MDTQALKNIVRVGVVKQTDASKLKARVWHDDLGILSGWLPVLQRKWEILDIADDNEHNHGGGVTVPDHNHEGSVVVSWMPKPGAVVVTLHIPVADGDGFVLGEIR